MGLIYMNIHVWVIGFMIRKHMTEMFSHSNDNLWNCQKLKDKIPHDSWDCQWVKFLKMEVLIGNLLRCIFSCTSTWRSWVLQASPAIIIQIEYALGHNPPSLITYVGVSFDKYIGPPWDQTQQKYVPIPLIQRSNKKQIPP